MVKASFMFSCFQCENISKKPKMASVRYFGGMWITFNEELQGQISACLQRTYTCIIRRGPRSNPTTPEYSQSMISYRLVYHPKPLQPLISKLKALLSLTLLIWPLMRGPRSNLTTPKDYKPMISYRLVYHLKPLGPIISKLKAL